MKIIIILLISIFSIALFSQNTFACECSWENPKMSKAEAKNFYLKNFNGAVFKGKVIEVKEELIDWDTEQTPFRKITVEVEEYWVGVNKPQMTIYTMNGGCGLDFEKGKQYFFAPSIYKERLVSMVCDYLFKDFFTEKEFSAIFGKVKSVKTKQ
jgi:hypothetical protein